ncbi:hypothetical protein NP493_1662g00004 [Ridgeia piscesae]|uniref:Epidermal growth factor-like protein 7 n=1 Tax=Ridgeia piscesae TaxID=27915 RepID=A0AAD9JVS7_RIDPI|nr:hypothetical protein NP493_1662g00004 [Ridgeia piscesae]
MCEMDGSYRLCTSFRVVYKMAYREAYVMQTEQQMVLACCPGWTQYNQGDISCMKPVCKRPCLNGGTCSGPNRCQCRKGWTGKQCQKDIDECARKTDGCQQICINTKGSFNCACADGFTVNGDRKTCKLCLSCLPEYVEMSTGYKNLAKRVSKLEKEKEELRNTVTKIRNEHQQTIQGLRSDIQSAAAAASRAPANDASAPMLAFDRSGWEHLASLSEQIALLEERIEGCEYCVVRVLSGWLAHVLSSLLIDFTSYV